MNVAVIRFPGTNCDEDLFGALKDLSKNFGGAQPIWWWHEDVPKVENIQGIVLPGGFSFGDYLRCGALAARAPVMKSVQRAFEQQIPILGICNGFQILCEAKLLPGVLLRNEGLRFLDKWVQVSVPETFKGSGFWHVATQTNLNSNGGSSIASRELRLPIAHGEGRYFLEESQLRSIENQGQVWLRYRENPNGSSSGIAGVTDLTGTVAALMPHPERAIKDWMGSEDGVSILKPLLLKKSSPIEVPKISNSKLAAYRIQPQEYEEICRRLSREPKSVELALFSALWSEHCSYKSSKVHLKKLFRSSKRVLQSMGENAGIVDLGQGEKVAFKMESHNHPSFIEPYQGAATGVGGILRDIFTMGARPIALANYLCFGSPEASRMSELVDGVVRGIGGYGNCVGVPTLTGQTEFHESYNSNILVNAMAVGLFCKNDPVVLSQAKGPGNYVVYVGAKTGRDGIHGASMASESFGESSSQKRPTVQIGDPFYEKLLIESCLEIMSKGLVVAIQDMGAAGLTSSTFEMASKGSVGIDLHLDLVPLRDSSLTPEEILLSESQERMLLICEPAKYETLCSVFGRWGLDAIRVGEVTSGPNVKLFWKTEVLTEIDPAHLVDNAPEYHRPFETLKNRRSPLQESSPSSVASSGLDSNLNFVLHNILSSVHGCSRDWIYRQYDQRVGAKTVKDCESSVSVVRLPDSGRGLGIVLGCRPSVMRWDAELGGADAVFYPALELAIKGFEPLALTDCLNFGNPENKNVMTDFVTSVSSMNLACQALDVPIISGNVSFYNETKNLDSMIPAQQITPTPSTGIVGLRPDILHIPYDEFQKSGERVYLVSLICARVGAAAGVSGPARAETEPVVAGDVNVEAWTKFVNILRVATQHPSVTTTRVCGKFGLGYTLARMSIPGIGCVIPHNSAVFSHRLLNQEDLFAETFYEVVVSLNAESEVLQTWVNDLETKLQPLGGKVIELGQTQPHKLQIGRWLDVSCESLLEKYLGGWRKNFENLA